MCGLAVTIRRGVPVSGEAMQRALALLAHRGPDAAATERVRILDRAGGLLAEAGLAHTRLAILDLDPRSNQPVHRNGHWLVYNGEIYNYRALAAGLNPRTSGDTEILLERLMRDGLAGLATANGMWAFCWLDTARRRLVAGRDRYGKKPLFYAFGSDAIHLASEPQALAALTGEPLAMEAAAADAFLADGWLFPDPSGATHLSGIRELPPGHALTLDLDSWQLDIAPAFALPIAGPAPDGEALAALLADAVAARLISDRKVGLFLSGGVDSSLILSILQARGLADNVVCITGDAGKSDDARYAQACIDQLGIPALKVPLPDGAQGMAQFLAVCRAQAKPFPLIGNVLGMHALYAAVAEQDVRVVLDGSGADEIFGGYWYRYFGFARRDAEAAGDADWLARVQPAMPRSFNAIDGRAGWMAGREGLAPSDPGLLRADARERLARTPPHDPLLGFAGTLTEAMALDATAGRMQEWLWQNDRNAMASGIENRSPFLDYRLAACLNAPRARQFDGPWNKRALRDMFTHFTPLPTAERRDKQGFRWSFSRFFGQNMAGVLELLAASRMVARHVEPGEFADAVRTGQITQDSPLLHRLTVLAGLEATGLGFREG